MTKPRKLAVGIGTAAAVCGVLASLLPTSVAWIFAWASLSCGLAAWAYVANRPGIYGKRRGRLVWWRAAPTAIFLGAFRIACALMRTWRGHPTTSRVSTSVWVAGRIEAADLPAGLDFVVDLVSEFPEPADVRSRPGYRFLAVLDGGVPPAIEPVLALLEELADPQRPTLVHCDSGMGRAPTFAALLMLRRGEADTVDEARAAIERARPFVHLGTVDRAFLAHVAPRVPRPNLPHTAAAS